ncbi:MAG: DNA repair protein RadA [Oscillospiraceae bacterium]|nr:DNA repair protein RadA [Oscillospiraceae bacterium]
MQTKIRDVYVCVNCGFECGKWHGKCPSCGQWNSMSEETLETKSTKFSRLPPQKPDKPTKICEISVEFEKRYKTGSSELDRVLGGGIVRGSLILVGGDPGVGKSTLLLQICKHLSKNLNILYVSGEETKRQIKLRSSRLKFESKNLYVMSQTYIDNIIDEIQKSKPNVVIIDSIQTMICKEINSIAGSVTQVRECTNSLVNVAKSLDIPIVIVGHVNKDGMIAGPKVLEHVVDVVLHFEGDKRLSYRILRCIKNRYGSTNEIGVFKMSNDGLCEVENPSLMLLSGRPQNTPGTCVTCVMEGSRPILAEIQGLVTKTNFGNPRRMSTGFDYNRLSLLLAILEKRAGCFLGTLDTYINVVGGLRLEEPSADLCVIMALISSFRDKIIKEDIIVFGEIGLAGELRSVPNAQERIIEAQKLGFSKCVMPFHNLKTLEKPVTNIEILAAKNIREAFGFLMSL